LLNTQPEETTQMTQQSINIGSAANDGTGDPLRTAFDKINDNFNEIYDKLGGASLSNITLSGSTITNTVTNGDLTIETNGTGKVIINDDLEVKGTTTEINATVMQIEDNLLELNRNSSGGDIDAGIFINRGAALDSAFFYWNEGEDKFKAVTSTSDDSVTTAVTDTATATIVANIDTQTITAIDGDRLTVSDSVLIQGNLDIRNNDSSSKALFVEGDVDITEDITCTNITVGSALNGFLSAAYGVQTNLSKIGSGAIKFNTNAEIKDSSNDVVLNNLTTNGSIVLQPQGTGGVVINGPISSSDSTELEINEILKVNETLIVNQIGTEDSSVINFQDPVQVNNGAFTVLGGKVAGQFFENQVQNDLTTSTTALSLTAGVHLLASGEQDYTLAAGSEGQVMYLAIAGGDSAVGSIANTIVTLSQVRDPDDGDVLATYAWKPFIGNTAGDSSTPKRTLAICVFAGGAWNLDRFGDGT